MAVVNTQLTHLYTDDGLAHLAVEPHLDGKRVTLTIQTREFFDMFGRRVAKPQDSDLVPVPADGEPTGEVREVSVQAQLDKDELIDFMVMAQLASEPYDDGVKVGRRIGYEDAQQAITALDRKKRYTRHQILEALRASYGS